MNQMEFEKSLDELVSKSGVEFQFITKWYEHALEQLSSMARQRSGIRHPRYLGETREADFIKLLKSVLPSSILTDHGFAINEYATKSYEQDCLLLDSARAATFLNADKTIYYPFDSVLGSVEIKSRLDLSELRKTILNCVSLKKLTYPGGISPQGFKEEPSVELAYFVFAFEAAWNLEDACAKVNKLLEPLPAGLRPNMFYILKQGLLLPRSEKGWELGPQQLFSKTDFGSQGKMGSKQEIPETDALPFLWFLSNILDHCLNQLDKRKPPWYGRYVFTPLFIAGKLGR